jgi:hypothetical protein
MNRPDAAEAGPSFPDFIRTSENIGVSHGSRWIASRTAPPEETASSAASGFSWGARSRRLNIVVLRLFSDFNRDVCFGMTLNAFNMGVPGRAYVSRDFEPVQKVKNRRNRDGMSRPRSDAGNSGGQTGLRG